MSTEEGVVCKCGEFHNPYDKKKQVTRVVCDSCKTVHEFPAIGMLHFDGKIGLRVKDSEANYTIAWIDDGQILDFCDDRCMSKYILRKRAEVHKEVKP